MQQTVKQVMSRNIVALLPGDTAYEAAALMNEHHVGSLPVVSGGEVKGILTDRDIVLRCVAGAKDPKTTRVSEIMSPDVVYVTPDQTVSDAAKMMASEQVRRLPVIKDGYIDGIISLADIARRDYDTETAEAISEISMPNIGPSGAVKAR